MRKTSSSVKSVLMSSVSSRAESRSWPNGFSMISRIQPSVVRRSPSSLDERRHRGRGDGEVVDAVAAGAALLVELGQELRELDPRRPRRRSPSAGSGCRSASQLPDVLLEVVAAELAHGAPPSASRNSSSVQSERADADDREALGQQPPVRERVEGGEDLAVREIARGAEDDDRARSGVRRGPRPSSSGFSRRARCRSLRLAPRGRRTGCAGPR